MVDTVFTWIEVCRIKSHKIITTERNVLSPHKNLKIHAEALIFFFFRVPPSFNMLKIQAGEQEKNQKYIYIYMYIYIYFFRFGCIAVYQSRNLCM